MKISTPERMAIRRKERKARFSSTSRGIHGTVNPQSQTPPGKASPQSRALPPTGWGATTPVPTVPRGEGEVDSSDKFFINLKFRKA